jgi:hypothetical protein
MRIEGQPGESMATAYLWLTPEEAKELMDTLGQLLRDGDYDAHHHISSAAPDRANGDARPRIGDGGSAWTVREKSARANATQGGAFHLALPVGTRA